MNPTLESELELCPLLKSCNPDDSQIEDYCCCGNYDNCEIYLQYKKNNFEAD